MMTRQKSRKGEALTTGRLVLATLILGVVVVSGCISGNVVSGAAITVYKSPTCGCCVQYVPELQKDGFVVETIVTQNMEPIKNRYGVPRDMESCHTAVIGEYFVEGHVPVEAVNKLLDERPDIDGIALPGMPSGSPGMPGPKRGPFTIYAIKDSKVTGVFMTI
jgi:hypothetical protein